MAIETFAQRQKAGRIYKLYFDPYAEHLLDFNLLDTLDFYGATSEIGSAKLETALEEIKNNLWAEMKAFDKKQLNKLK